LITIEETLEFLSIAFLTSIFYKQIILNKNKL